MSIQGQALDRRIEPLPEELQSPRAKLVYLYLTTTSGASVDELCDTLGLKKITIYSILRTLEERELVSQDVDDYVCC